MSIMIGGVSVGGALATGALTAAAGAAVGYGANALMGGMGGGAGGGGKSGGSGMDKKWIKKANKVSDQGLKMSQGVISNLQANLDASNAAYRAAMTGFSNEFNNRINTAIGGAPDYWTNFNQAQEQQKVVINEFDQRASTLAEDSANQAMNWNLANQEKMIAFSKALQVANEQAAIEGEERVNPGFKGLMAQLNLNAMNNARGIISAEDAATLSRNAAQTSLGAGTGLGSALNRNLTFRDFGLAQFQAQDRGLLGAAKLKEMSSNILAGTKVNSFDVANWMGLNTRDVLDTNRQTLTNWAQLQTNLYDDRIRSGEVVLGTRADAAKTDYTLKAGMEGNIYSGNIQTYNNVADLGVRAVENWGNQRLGVVSQGWNNQQARYAAGVENSAALQRAGIESAATIGGAAMAGYFNRGTSLTNTSTVSGATTTTPTGREPGGGISSGSLILTDK